MATEQDVKEIYNQITEDTSTRLNEGATHIQAINEALLAEIGKMNQEFVSLKLNVS